MNSTGKLLNLLLLFLLLAGATLPAQAQEPEAAPGLNPRFGIVDSFVNTEAANAAGAGWSRVFFRWDVIQPGGSADWKPANVPDPFIEAEVAAGREIVGVIIGTPPWASDDGASTAMPPLERWGDFVFKLATQYQDRVSHWVIWNQPDINDPSSTNYTWAGTEEDYYRLLKEAYTKIKAVDPAMQVHLAGLTYTWDEQQAQPQYLERLLEIITQDPDAAANNYFFDTVSYHYYYNPGQLAEMIETVRGLLAVKGLEQKPIWINETNAPPSEDFIEPPAGPPPFQVTLEEQSYFVIQTFSLALAAGAERVAINKLRNENSLAASVVPFGLLRADNSRRPAFDAFQTAAIYFRNIQQADWTRLNNIYVVTLDQGEQTTTVLWNTGQSPTAYRLPAISNEALLVDERGNRTEVMAAGGVHRIELPAAPCANGDYCFIGGAPRLLVEAGSPAQRAALSPVRVEATVEPAVVEVIQAATSTPAPPPTLTPVPESIDQEVPTAPAGGVIAPPTPLPGTENDTTAFPPADVLPDPDFDPGAAGGAPPDLDSAAPTVVPPVTLTSILRPERLLWLFLIAIIVFTVSYGIQVAIWYRLRR